MLQEKEAVAEEEAEEEAEEFVEGDESEEEDEEEEEEEVACTSCPLFPESECCINSGVPSATMHSVEIVLRSQPSIVRLIRPGLSI